MTKRIVWRLPSRPTSEEVRGLLKDGILSKDEAREILFNLEDSEERDKKSLEAEIKFLRELVTNLSSRQTIVETIREVHKPYQNYPWYQPYQTWCSSGSTLTSGSNTASAMYLNTATATGSSTISFTGNVADEPFSGVKTF
jgi:hypothetical protein